MTTVNIRRCARQMGSVKSKGGKKRVVVAMSGGVDSSVAAELLCRAGYDVIGISIKFWTKEFCAKGKPKSCCSAKDLSDARFVAGQLGIPFYAVDLSKQFKEEVMDYFCKEYSTGRTPNPCIVCNNKIKFGSLLRKAKELDADYIATGHYAKVCYNKKSRRFVLKRGKDRAKDQSYVLFGLRQGQLELTILPLGSYLKSEVRQISKKLGLKVAEKPESQEICFVWDNNYPEFLKNTYGIKPEPGRIITEDGKFLGTHPGVIFFTIGQRRGLGLGGNKGPLYVVGIDVKKNLVIVGGREELKKKVLFADGLNWMSIKKLEKAVAVKAKIRYNHQPAPAVIHPQGEASVKVIFDRPQSAITPGQAAVFYRGDVLLGGGWIR